MNWPIFASISIVSISIANIFQKKAMKDEKSDPIISSIVFQFLLTIFTGVFALIKYFKIPSVDIVFPYFVISTFLYAFGTLLSFKAIKMIEASEMTILTGFGAIATVISAFLFLNERLSLYQMLGVVLVLLSIFIVEFKRKEFKIGIGALYAVLATILYGLAVTNDANILKSYDAISYTPIMSFLPGLVLCLIYPNKTTQLIKDLKHHISTNLGIYSFLYGIQAVTYYLALEKGAFASQMGVISKTQIIATVILASIYLKERENILKKVIAAILTTIGVILIA